MRQRTPLNLEQKLLALIVMMLLNSPMFAWLWYWGIYRNYFSRGLGPPHFVGVAGANLLFGVPLSVLITEKWIRKG